MNNENIDWKELSGCGASYRGLNPELMEVFKKELKQEGMKPLQPYEKIRIHAIGTENGIYVYFERQDTEPDLVYLMMMEFKNSGSAKTFIDRLDKKRLREYIEEFIEGNLGSDTLCSTSEMRGIFPQQQTNQD